MKLQNLPGLVTICLINTIRPFLGPAECKFGFSCTRYAELQLKQKPFFTACFTITKRVLACNPLNTAL